MIRHSPPRGVLPLEAWSIVIQGVYPAYIGHETFLANRRKLRANRYNFDAKGRGAAREGAALLQGLVHCGRCGRQMGMSYGRQQPRYQCRYVQTHMGWADVPVVHRPAIDERGRPGIPRGSATSRARGHTRCAARAWAGAPGC